MPTQLSIRDLFDQSDAISAYLKIRGDREWMIKKHFDPRAVHMNRWMSYYDLFKLFLPTLTKKNLKQMLLDYRKEFYEK